MTLSDFLQQVKECRVSGNNSDYEVFMNLDTVTAKAEFLPMFGFSIDSVCVLIIDSDALQAEHLFYMTEFCRDKGCGIREVSSGVHPKRKTEMLCSDYLISVVYDMCPYKKDVILERAPLGKPHFTGTDAIPFSISHSGNLITLVFSIDDNARLLGADLEKYREIRENVINKICTEEEKQCVNSISDGNKDCYCTRLWTAKEAVVKALGTGISSLTPAFSVLENTVCVSNHNFVIRTFSIKLDSQNYWLSIAVGIS